MTYVISVATNRNLDLAVTLPSELANVVRLCLRGRGYSESQKLATLWISEGIDSVVFPSATGTGRNVAVYLANATAGNVVVRNRAERNAGVSTFRSDFRRGSALHDQVGEQLDSLIDRERVGSFNWRSATGVLLIEGGAFIR